MNKFALAAFAPVAALALSACGSSDSAKEEAAPDNVEMPAEEAVTDVEATPALDPAASAAATSDAAAPVASDAPAAPASAAPAPTATR